MEKIEESTLIANFETGDRANVSGTGRHFYDGELPHVATLKESFRGPREEMGTRCLGHSRAQFQFRLGLLRQPRINLLANSPFGRHSPRYHLSESPSWYGELLTPPNPLSVLSPNNGTIHAGSTPQSSKDDTSMPRDHLTDEQNLNAQSVIGVTTCGG